MQSARRDTSAEGQANKAAQKRLLRLPSPTLFTPHPSLLNNPLTSMQVRQALGGSLLMAVSGGAPLSPQLEAWMRVALNCLAVQGYGLTETCSVSTLAIPGRTAMQGTVGPIMSCLGGWGLGGDGMIMGLAGRVVDVVSGVSCAWVGG